MSLGPKAVPRVLNTIIIDLFHQIHGVYIVHTLLKVHKRLTGHKPVNQSEEGSS